MSNEQVMTIFQAAVSLGLKLALPILIMAMIIGLTISILQAATQVQEQTLTFAPKAIGITLALLAAGPWMTNEILDFMRLIFNTMAGTPVR